MQAGFLRTFAIQIIYMLAPWHKGKIISIKDVAPNTKLFTIEATTFEKFDFLPGQFITLDLPIHEKKNKRWRSYSIVSAPDNHNIFELLISYFEGGAGTGFLFHELTAGSEIMFRGPQGVFTLPAKIEKNIFFICTGTGIAPFRSMLQHIYKNQIAHKEIYLIFGTRKEENLLYADELRLLEKEINNFHYFPVFSRESPEKNNIMHGYVHAVYENILQTKKTDATFYLCGWKNMIDDAEKKIIALGYDRNDIRLELYG